MTFLLSLGYASIEFLHAGVATMSGWLPLSLSASQNLLVVAFVLFVLANGLKKAKPSAARRVVSEKRVAAQGFGAVNAPVHQVSGR